MLDVINPAATCSLTIHCHTMC